MEEKKMQLNFSNNAFTNDQQSEFMEKMMEQLQEPGASEFVGKMVERLQKPETIEMMTDGLQELAKLQQLYQAAIREVSTKLEILDDEFNFLFDRNPIHHIESRFKAPQSIIEKLIRKGHDISTKSARENIMDIAGVRVTCSYIEDIYTIAELLTKQDDVTLLRKTDYISNPKSNGYRSLHLVVSVPIFLSTGKELVPVEIQIRTIAMDFWASLEHQIRYKGVGNIPKELAKDLKDCADVISETDLKMQDINHKLSNLYMK